MNVPSVRVTVKPRPVCSTSARKRNSDSRNASSACFRFVMSRQTQKMSFCPPNTAAFVLISTS